MPRRRKKTRTHVEEPETGAPGEAKAPRSFVFRRGKGSAMVSQLVSDMRRVMQPHTATNLKESKKNHMKDFLHVAPVLGVTHFLVFSQTDVSVNLRVIRIPRGPTLTFRLMNYSHMKDIAARQKRPHSPGSEYDTPPLVVLNNFSGGRDDKQIMAAMFQNLFPAINVRSVKLSDTRRVVLLNYDSETEAVEFRHYLISASPVGLTKTVKRVIKAKLPNLHDVNDIADYVFGNEGAAGLSDSEAEDTPECKVTLSQDFRGRGNRRSQKSAIRLQELGPRMSLKLLKIQEEFDGGRVIYHDLIQKTPEEAAELRAKKAKEEAARAARRAEQEENVRRKKEAAEERRQKKIERATRRREAREERRAARDGSDGESESEDSEDDLSDDSMSGEEDVSEEEEEDAEEEESGEDEDEDEDVSGDEDSDDDDDDEEDEEEEAEAQPEPEPRKAEAGSKRKRGGNRRR